MKNLKIIDWYFNGVGFKKIFAKILVYFFGISPSALTIYTFNRNFEKEDK